MTARMRQGSGGTAELEGPTVEQPQMAPASNPTIRQKLENAMRQGGTEQTAELAIDDLGLDLGQVDTIDQPGDRLGRRLHARWPDTGRRAR